MQEDETDLHIGQISGGIVAGLGLIRSSSSRIVGFGRVIAAVAAAGSERNDHGKGKHKRDNFQCFRHRVDDR